MKTDAVQDLRACARFIEANDFTGGMNYKFSALTLDDLTDAAAFAFDSLRVTVELESDNRWTLRLFDRALVRLSEKWRGLLVVRCPAGTPEGIVSTIGLDMSFTVLGGPDRPRLMVGIEPTGGTRPVVPGTPQPPKDMEPPTAEELFRNRVKLAIDRFASELSAAETIYQRTSVRYRSGAVSTTDMVASLTTDQQLLAFCAEGHLALRDLAARIATT